MTVCQVVHVVDSSSSPIYHGHKPWKKLYGDLMGPHKRSLNSINAMCQLNLYQCIDCYSYFNLRIYLDHIFFFASQLSGLMIWSKGLYIWQILCRSNMIMMLWSLWFGGSENLTTLQLFNWVKIYWKYETQVRKSIKSKQKRWYCHKEVIKIF